MFAVLRNIGLDRYIANENIPGVAKEGQPTEEIESSYLGSSRNKPSFLELVTKENLLVEMGDILPCILKNKSG